MSDLDYFALSRFFGSKMQPISKPVFGPFGLLPLEVETAKARLRPEPAKVDFTLQQEKRIARSFEHARGGLPPDALLWDMEMRTRFFKKCRGEGLEFAEPDLVRRLLAIRKNPQKYAKLGITLSPTRQKEKHPEILLAYAPIIEFALARLRYLHGKSIDEILIDSELGEQLESAAHGILPHLSSKAIRQAALAIRKTRYLAKGSRAALKVLKTQKLRPAWSPPQSLASLDLSTVPPISGLIEISEPSRELYISRNANLHGALELLTKNDIRSILANPFWTPNLSEINARFIPETELKTAALERWELKLLCEQSPVFNWPIRKPKRAA